MDNGDKSAKILVIFIIAIFAFGLSNCVAFLSNGIINSDFSNHTEDNNNSSDIFEFNTSSKNESPQNYKDNSNTNSKSNNDNEIIVNDEPNPEPIPPQENNTLIETDDED